MLTYKTRQGEAIELYIDTILLLQPLFEELDGQEPRAEQYNCAVDPHEFSRSHRRLNTMLMADPSSRDMLLP
jgi:hypothetical protein